MPNKGNLIDARTGTIDKITKGPLLVELVYSATSLPSIGSVTEHEPTETPTIFIQPTNIIRFQNTAPVETNAITFGSGIIF